MATSERMSAYIAYNQIHSLVNKLAENVINLMAQNGHIFAYLELGVCLLLEDFPHLRVVGVQELERLGDGCHRAGGTLDLSLDVVGCLHSLSKFPAVELLYQEVDLVLESLIFFILTHQAS